MSKPKMKIKKGDQVVVISGKDKGKQALVTAVIAKEGKPLECLLEGLNLKSHYTKPNPEKYE